MLDRPGHRVVARPYLRSLVACTFLILLTGAATILDASEPDRSTEIVHGPVDLSLSFRSPVDNADCPCRLYLPSAHDGKQKVPLLIALHGTSGNQNTYFDAPTYQNGIYKREAEKRGIAVVCPLGRDRLDLPTEWRGIGENNVLMVLQEVCRRFQIDEDRIVCTGQSMGGTGTTYLCCRYPDLFAGGIPLASTYGHVSLVTNLRHVPMFYVQGENDWPIYAQDGPIPLTRQMQALGYQGTLWMVPGAKHNTMDVSTERVLDWALQQRRVRHPRHVTFRAYLPIHGRAYWTEIQKIDQIGYFAEIGATVEGNRITISIANATQVALRPEAELLSLNAPIEVLLAGKSVFNGPCQSDEEIRLTKTGDAWTATVVPRHVRPRTDYRIVPVGIVVQPPTWEGTAETTMGNWKADFIRDATGADIAICTRGHARGVPLVPGQTVFLIDLLNWIRPTGRCLVRFKMRGADLLEILEDSIHNDKKKAQFLVQVSGCRYAFDRTRPKGKRIVSADIDPERTYTVGCESHLLTRTDCLYLEDRYGKIPFETLELTTYSAAWRYIERCGGRIEAALDGRVCEPTGEGHE